MNELATNNKKNIRYVNKRINEFTEIYQPRNTSGSVVI